MGRSFIPRTIAHLGPVSRTSRELFGPEKLVVKLQSARFEKLIFLQAFNIRKIKRIAKFEGLEPRRCEDIKGIVVPDIGPKSFGTFEKQAPGHHGKMVSRDHSLTVNGLECISRAKLHLQNYYCIICGCLLFRLFLIIVGHFRCHVRYRFGSFSAILDYLSSL